jgi:hypothetical protein
MRFGIPVAIFSIFLLATTASQTVAVKGAMERRVVPIAKVLELAEEADRFTVEGQVTDILTGQGQNQVYKLSDDSGEIFVMIPNFLEREHGAPEQWERIRVSGEYAHALGNREGATGPPLALSPRAVPR